MRVRTLIATEDGAYCNQISQYISEHYSNIIDITVCNHPGQLQKTLAAKRYDAALMDPAMINQADLHSIDLPLALWTESNIDEMPSKARLIKKHMRISKTVTQILEQYAAIRGTQPMPGEPMGKITAFWSPCGGAGTTTVALAYAQSKAHQGREVFYLNMEAFASTPAYFSTPGKSISTVFEMLESSNGSISLMIQAIRCRENNISYLCAPDNFDDICILSDEDISELVSCCAQVSDELIIDLSCVCDSNTRRVFELSDSVMLVTDNAQTTKAKQEQFFTQSNVFDDIKDKLTLVINRVVGEYIGMNGALTADKAAAPACGGKPETPGNGVLLLPFVDSTDVQFICSTLSKSSFVKA